MDLSLLKENDKVLLVVGEAPDEAEKMVEEIKKIVSSGEVNSVPSEDLYHQGIKLFSSILQLYIYCKIPHI